MLHFIEQFYLGNLDPQNRRIKPGSPAQRQMDILAKNEELLTEWLSGEQSEVFLEYVNAWHEINSASCLDSFITGFRLGASFAYDAFVDTESPFEGGEY